MASLITMIRFFALLISCVAAAHAGVLYDSQLRTVPAQQGWIYLADPQSAQATQANADGFGVVLNTPVASDKAGYFSQLPFFGAHPGVGTLDRVAGYTLNFRVRLLAEAHNNNDRAGFSIIVLSSDQRGLELAFWADQIWAQSDSPIFTHGESVAGNFLNRVLRLALRIQGDTYTLLEGETTLLTGPLRNYASFGLPYTIRNFIFFGDDTTSSSAKVEITRIALNDQSVLPPSIRIAETLEFTLREPATYLLQSADILPEWQTHDTLTTISKTHTVTLEKTSPQRFFRAVMTDPPLPQ